MEDVADYAERLREGRWFGSLTAACQEWILSRAVLREFVEGQTLFQQGDRPNGLYSVLRGAVSITSMASSGRAVVLARMEPTSWFGEVFVFDGEPRSHSATAEEASLVLHLSDSYVEPLLEAHPTFARDVGRLLATKFRFALAILEEMSVVPVPVRFARRLLMMVEGYGERPNMRTCSLNLRQEELGSMMAVSRQTANAVLKELVSRGIIALAYGRIDVLDVDALRLAAQGGG